MSKRVKIYSICTEPHEVLRDEYYLPSLPSNLEPVIQNVKAEGQGEGKFRSASFKHAIKYKLQMTLDAIEENMGDIFIISDLDLCFFREFDPYELIQDYEVVGQKASMGNGKKDGICGGFYICKANENTKGWIERCIEDSPISFNGLEQSALNKWKNVLGLKTATIDRRFLNPRKNGNARHLREWLSENNGELAKNIVLFHANYRVGISAKINLMDQVIKWVEEYKNRPSKEFVLKQIQSQKFIVDEMERLL
tara:strand:+ start:2629 stop:3384 length:756 start_codon:yes stop_codon:yes gene_type:complete